MKKLTSIILSSVVAASALTDIAFATTDASESVETGLYYTTGWATFYNLTGTLKFVKSGTIQNPTLKAQYEKSETGNLKLNAWYNAFNVP